MHVFVSGHGCTQVEILEINRQELGIWRGHNTVDQDFGGSKVGCLGADVEWVFNLVPTDGPANAVRIDLFGPHGGNDAQVLCLAAAGNGRDSRDEENCVGAFYGTEPLCVRGIR